MARKFALKSRTAAGEIDFAADLNREQLAVATAGNGPMLVIAGGGGFSQAENQRHLGRHFPSYRESYSQTTRQKVWYFSGFHHSGQGRFEGPYRFVCPTGGS